MKLDPRLVFYLKHRQQIDEWATLHKLLPTAVEEFFGSVAEPLRERLAGLEGEPILYVSPDEGAPKIFLAAPAWIPKHKDRPLVAIGLEWGRGNLEFDGAYTGIWANLDEEGGQDLHNRITAAITALGLLEGFETIKWWPARKYEIPNESKFWEDMDSFRKDLLNAIIEAWNRYFQVVDTTIAGSG